MSQKPHLEDMIDKKYIKEIEISLNEGEHIKPLAAGFIAIKNNANARAFIEKWLGYCEQKQLIRQPQGEQVLLGLTAYKYPNGVYAMPSKAFGKFLEWHHRRPNINPQNSLLPCLLKHVSWSEGRLVNSKIFRMFRDFALTHLTNIQKRLKKTAASSNQ
ncbi:MAG: hypothetical protein V4482_01145 [Pseudomonadota bacterium]